MAEVRRFFPAWRVFVFGVDVTNDVTRCSIAYSGSTAQGPSVAEIELVNGGRRGDSAFFGDDRYVVTAEDIATLYGAEAELPNIRFASDKEVLADLVAAGRIEDPGTTANLPALSAALAIISPSAATGDPAEDATRAVADANRLGLSTLAYQREAYRRSVAASVRRERDARNLTQVAARQDELDQIVRKRIEANIRDDVKRRVLLRKFNFRQQIEVQPNLVDTFTQTSIAGLPQLNGQALRYPFQTGDCIFHSNDAVRIAWRDPTTTDRWYWMFAGFVSDWIETTTEDNEKSMTLRIEDPTRILRYARLSTNPGVLDEAAQIEATDGVTRTFFNDGFADLSLPQFLFTVIFGADKAGTRSQTGTQDLEGVQTFSNLRVGVNGQTSSKILLDAVGVFNFESSFVGLFGPPGSEDAEQEANALDVRNVVINSLGEYQALVDHQVFPSDVDNMALNEPVALSRIDELRNGLRRRVGSDTPVIEDVVQLIGEHPELFPVDNGRLIFLVPASLGPATNKQLLLKDIIGVNVQTTWISRLQLIYDVMGRIDFEFFASPKGDLLCEMPLYDFEPDDFGRGLVNMNDLLARADINYTVGNETRGPYGANYTVAKRDTQSWQREFIDDNVRTKIMGVWNNIPAFAQTGGTSADIGLFAPVRAPGLAPQFGWRAESIDPLGIITNENAARIYANVVLNQFNAEARKANVEILPRVQLAFLNRPLEFEERQFVATTSSINHVLVWGLNGDMTLDLNLKYVRAWSGQTTSDNRPVYEPIGGFASGALNYALRLGQRESSIRSTREN